MSEDKPQSNTTEERFETTNQWPVILIGILLAVLNINSAVAGWSSLDWEGWEGYRSTGRALGFVLSTIFATFFPIAVYFLLKITRLKFGVRVIIFLLVGSLAVLVNCLICSPVEYIMRYHY